MEWGQYQSLGLATDWDTKAGGNLPNPNGPSWANDAAADEPYVLPRESLARQPGVHKGRTVAHLDFKSTTYPGTTRDWWVHIPAECYLTGGPCSLIVFQDGGSYRDEGGTVRAAILLDNLVHAGSLLPTVAVFINPGAHPDVPGQRSVEYDVISDRYATFLSDEILPLVEHDFENISADPDRRAICGASSGGICAFSVAWHRPDLFANVISHVGSFANIRGGHHYPWLIRNTKRKPIRRVHLQDGTADADNGNGHWVLANQQMAVALKYAGYEVKIEIGSGCHSTRHGGAVLAETLAWIWPTSPPPPPLPKL